MATFTDSFNRADGPLGNGWTVINGQFSIISNMAAANGGSEAIWDQGTSPARQVCTITCHNVQAGYSGPGAGVKVDSVSHLGYWAYIYDDGSGKHLYIIRGTPGAPTVLGNINIGGAVPDDYTIAIEYDGGTIHAWWNGALQFTGADNTHAANVSAGIHGLNTSARIDSVTVESGAARTLDINPTEVYGGNPLNYLSATLIGGTWTTVEPPSASLSVDHGWLVLQTMETDTRINFSWQALNYIGTVTVTESEFGATGTFYSTGSPVPENGDSFPLTEAGAELINNGDASCPDAAILTTCTPIDGEGTVNIPTGIDAIIEQLGGYPGQIGADIGAISLPALLYALYEKPNPLDHYTINDILGLLGGSPTLYSHQDILDAVNPIRTTDLPAIQAYLEAMRGNNVVTILQLVTTLTNIQTLEGYTLGSVMDAIAAIPPANLQAVLDKLNLIQPNEAHDLSTITAALQTINQHAAAVDTSLAAYRTGNLYTVQDILDRLDTVEAKIDALSLQTAPVWPGLAGVTIGGAVALVDQLVLSGPMHGILVNVTSPPVGLGQYRVGGRRLDYGQMRIAFETDNGELEGWQYFGFEQAIYTPHSMTIAANCRFQLLGGLGGTVAPWTRS